MSQVAFYDRLVMNQQSYDKTALSLNLGNGRPTVSSRKRKFLQPSAILQSPDLKLLKLGSPELEKLIIQNNGFIPTPTVNGEHVEDQESFARGFIEALQKLQQEESVPPQTKSWDFSRISSLSNSSYPVSTSHSLPPYSTMSNASKWEHHQADHNLNTVPISVITNRYENNQTPPISRQSTPTPNLGNYPIASSGAVTTMGLTSIPKSNNIYMTKPPLTTPEMSFSNTISSPTTLLDIKTEDDMPPSVGSSNSSLNLDVNPIDLDAQEQIKHQRKKLRNRLAAQRCRKRKIEREDTLKQRVKELKNKNTELTGLASNLRMQVCELKQQVMHHINEGCQVLYKEDDKS